MKKFLPILFILLSSQVFAQTNFRFADSTAQWNVLKTQYYFAPIIDWSTEIFAVGADTTIGSHSYQIIQYNSAITPLETNGRYYIRKDTTNKVFGRINRDSLEYLVYDFGKQPGDTFSIGFQNNWSQAINIKVDSVSSVFWGHSRKVMYVTVSSIGIVNDIFVEGIGSLHSFFLYPGIDYSFFDGPGYNLLCYSENSITVYHDSLFNTCVFDSTWAGISELNTYHFSVLPNPVAENFITIQSGTNFPTSTTFQLFDITGRMVLQKPLSDKVSRIELSEISKGMYLYNITSLQKKIGSGKLAVQ